MATLDSAPGGWPRLLISLVSPTQRGAPFFAFLAKGFEAVGRISNGKSASSAGSTEVPAGRVPTQSDHSPHCGNAICSPGTAPSFAQRHAPEGTESALAHRRPDGKGGHKFCEGRAVQETGFHKPLLYPSRHPK